MHCFSWGRPEVRPPFPGRPNLERLPGDGAGRCARILGGHGHLFHQSSGAARCVAFTVTVPLPP